MLLATHPTRSKLARAMIMLHAFLVHAPSQGSCLRGWWMLAWQAGLWDAWQRAAWVRTACIAGPAFRHDLHWQRFF